MTHCLGPNHAVDHAPACTLPPGVRIRATLRGGFLSEATSPDGVSDYAYDALGQCTRPWSSGRTIQYDYDAAGNRRRVIHDGVITAYQTNLLDQYTQVGTSLRQYDSDGNVIQEVGATVHDTIYQYDDAKINCCAWSRPTACGPINTMPWGCLSMEQPGRDPD